MQVLYFVLVLILVIIAAFIAAQMLIQRNRLISAGVEKDTPYKIFNDRRGRYTGQTKDAAALISLYYDNVQLGIDSGINDLIPYKPSDKIRLMSWNVRYFTNAHDEPTINDIVAVVKSLDPDILLLQEATAGYNKFYKGTVDISSYLPDYYVLSACSVGPSWYSDVYGNMIIIKKEFASRYASRYDMLLNEICKPGSERCDFNQYQKTFDQPRPGIRVLNGEEIATNASKETRCFIKISLTEFDIICTHLEAYDSGIRESQLEEIMKNVTRPTIIAGDFNIVDSSLYSAIDKTLIWSPGDSAAKKAVVSANLRLWMEWDYVRAINQLPDNFQETEYAKMAKKHELVDLFAAGTKPNISCWANTVVDYMFLANATKTFKYKPYVHFNKHTDHLPLIIDIDSRDYISLSANQDKSTWDDIENGRELSADEIKDITGLYNGQALAAYDWWDPVTKAINVGRNYDFSDPYKLGNFANVYGSYGVYIATDTSVAGNYGGQFQQTFVSNNAEYRSLNKGKHGLEYPYLLFSWKFTPRRDVRAFYLKYISQKIDQRMFKALDDKYDIITGPMHAKFTKKGYNPATGTHGLITIDDICIVIPAFVRQFEPINAASNDALREALPAAVYILLLNAIWLINKENYRRHGAIYIDIDKITAENVGFIVSRTPTETKFSLVKYFALH